jgi:hypothetical protein
MDTEATAYEREAKLKEEIEERLRELARLTHPEDVMHWVERIYERMHDEIWHT